MDNTKACALNESYLKNRIIAVLYPVIIFAALAASIFVSNYANKLIDSVLDNERNRLPVTATVIDANSLDSSFFILYEVKGNKYERAIDADKLPSRTGVGSKVELYCNPQNPTDVVSLEIAAQVASTLMLYSFVLFAFAVWATISFFDWRIADISKNVWHVDPERNLDNDTDDSEKAESVSET